MPKHRLLLRRMASVTLCLNFPFNGTVADVSVDVGQQVDPQTVAVSITDPSEWIVETNHLTELEVVNLAVGQKVTMVPMQFPILNLRAQSKPSATHLKTGR